MKVCCLAFIIVLCWNFPQATFGIVIVSVSSAFGYFILNSLRVIAKCFLSASLLKFKFVIDASFSTMTLA